MKARDIVLLLPKKILRELNERSILCEEVWDRASSQLHLETSWNVLSYKSVTCLSRLSLDLHDIVELCSHVCFDPLHVAWDQAQ